jgi:hypothetical protein
LVISSCAWGRRDLAHVPNEHDKNRAIPVLLLVSCSSLGKRLTYAAAEAKTSWRLALVKRDRTPEKINVETNNTAMMIATVLLD